MSRKRGRQNTRNARKKKALKNRNVFPQKRERESLFSEGGTEGIRKKGRHPELAENIASNEASMVNGVLSAERKKKVSTRFTRDLGKGEPFGIMGGERRFKQIFMHEGMSCGGERLGGRGGGSAGGENTIISGNFSLKGMRGSRKNFGVAFEKGSRGKKKLRNRAQRAIMTGSSVKGQPKKGKKRLPAEKSEETRERGRIRKDCHIQCRV